MDEKYKNGDLGRPTIDELLHVVSEEGKFSIPDSRLDKIERRLSDDIYRMRIGDEFSPSLNVRVFAQMLALALAGRKVRKDTLWQYKKALERYNLDPETGYLP